MIADAPAAHSMDTDWYGVDPAGNVARLQSGEEGAVPYDAHRQYWDELYRDLAIARIAARSPVEPHSGRRVLEAALAASRDPAEVSILRAILDGDDASRAIYADYLEARGRLPRPTVYIADREFRAIAPETLPHEWSGVLRFASNDYLELFRAEYHWDEWRPLDADLGLPFAVAAQRVQKWAFDDYWNQGVITTAYVIDYPIDPHLVGLYEYNCSFSGPYYRRETPAEPLRFDELPESLRLIIGRLRIPISFETLTDFDPQRWFECQTYG